MKYAIVETGYRPSIYTATAITDELGISGRSVYIGSYFITFCGLVLSLHIYESEDDLFGSGETADILIMPEISLVSQFGRSVVEDYLHRLMNSMIPGTRRSNAYRFNDYSVDDRSRYTYRLDNDITKDLCGTILGGYIDLFSTMLLMTAFESKFYISDVYMIGKRGVCKATVTNSTFLDSLCIEAMFVQDTAVLES